MVAFSKFSFQPDYLCSYPETKTKDGYQLASNGVKNAKRVYYSNHCYFNAHYNRKNYQPYNHLKPVYGSLRINGTNIFGKGGRNIKDFKDLQSSHCWLEDDEGNVYDYIFDHYYTGGNRSITPVSKGYSEWEIVGLSKKDLKDIGIEFIPANKETQKAIHNSVKKGYENEGWLDRLVFNRLVRGWAIEDILIDHKAFQ